MMIIIKVVAICLLAAVSAAGLYVLFLILNGLFVDITREYETDSPYFRALLNSGVWCAKLFARLKINDEGFENIPHGRFLLVGNHRSKFDPIVTWYALRHNQLAFISKPENFKIPFYGPIIRRCCCLSIDRENARSSLKTLYKAAELIKSGEVSVGVYPEGTRSQSCELLPFHNGVFKIAKNANVPIVVVCTQGTEKVHINFPLKPTSISVKVTDVIPADYVKTHRTEEIGARVRASLLECMNADGPEERIKEHLSA
ncbi:MAG: lysophospholipid acyltransferase family protein [Bacillota bacterium]|nr:lysophospholipid acyltransferase family protein [Bacillota bacterium]